MAPVYLRDKTMKLRTKTLLSVAFISAVICASLLSLSYFYLQPSFNEIERQATIEKMDQAKNMLNYRATDLAVEVADYAVWDDTYNFVKNPDPQYLESNFVDSTFQNLKLNLIAIVNEKNEALYCQSYDLSTLSKIQTNQEIQQMLVSDEIIWSFGNSNEEISGIMLVDNKPMLIATAPILTSASEGPVLGGMLFGKYLDEEDFSTMTQIVGFDISLSTFSDFQKNPTNEFIVDTLLSSKQNIVQKVNSENSISGFSLISDVHSDSKFIFQITHSRTVYQQGVFVVNVFLGATLTFSLLFGLFILVLLEREIVKPMTRLASYVEEISLNTNSSPPPSLKHGAEEIAVVSDAVRNTLKRKLEGMNEVSRMVAHDLRNPLTGIKNTTYLIKSRYGQKMEADGKDMLKTIDECITYSDKVIQNLLDYSSEIKLKKLIVSSKSLVDKVLAKFVLPRNVNLINEANDEILLNVDTDKIERVFTNLIANALDAMPDGGTIKITSKIVKDSIVLDFSDTGKGMSKQVLDKLWTPFFTTKAKGLGIGLSICKRIIDAHQGKIEVQSVEGKGTRFSVFLPVAQ
jgi:signal transduction histidine kinase